MLSFISNLDFKPLFVPTEANLGSVYWDPSLFNFPRTLLFSVNGRQGVFTWRRASPSWQGQPLLVGLALLCRDPRVSDQHFLDNQPQQEGTPFENTKVYLFQYYMQIFHALSLKLSVFHRYCPTPGITKRLSRSTMCV